MRYYIYLDKCFLRTLFSAVANSNFNIDVVEYSVRKSYSNNSQLSIDPCIEDSCGGENFFEEKCEEEAIDNKGKNTCFNTKKLRVGVENGTACNIQTERKYINIADITDMKNTGFYHKLVEDIRENSRDSDTRICEVSGFIETYQEPASRDGLEYIQGNDDFFRIDNTCVWFEKDKMQGNIKLLSKMSCKIKVIGYTMNCIEKTDNKIIKAIAIYIE